VADQPDKPRDDDMHDPKDRGAPFPLGEFLTLCDPCAESPEVRPCLRKDFEDADASAVHAQMRYRVSVGVAAVAGLIALLIGLGQRAKLPETPPCTTSPNRWLPVEFAYTLLALISVLAAILTGKQAHWLSKRFRAERLRLLKFKLLIDPKLWHTSLRDLTPWRNRLETGRSAIADQSEENLDALKLSDAMPDLPATDDCLAVEVPALQRLLEYYRRKRLGFQLEYFERRARKKSILANPRLPPIFFFSGIALVLCNDILEWATQDALDSHRGELTILGLALLSFAVPMGWSAIRTVRGAHEFSRNAARSHARHAALAELSRSLDAATAGPPERWDRPVVFGYLYLCEGILASDQHEWIRLMRDAEWYG
jgi:hypothetical protein